MNHQEVFQTCLDNLQEARLYFEQGLGEEAIEILEGTLGTLNESKMPEVEQNNLRYQIESYINTLKKLSQAPDSPTETEEKELPPEEIDPARVYKHALALMNGQLWEEAIREFQKVVVSGYHVMECWELCGDCAVSLKKWEEATSYYETVYNDPSTPRSDQERLDTKIARCVKALEEAEAKAESVEHAKPESEETERDSTRVLKFRQKEAEVPEAKKEKGALVGKPPVQEQIPQPRSDQEYQARIKAIHRHVRETEKFQEVFPKLEKEILPLFQAERMTIYQRGRQDREIVARYKTGEDLKEIRVPFSYSSIAGFVALTQRALCISDVHDRNYLASIHPELRFDETYDHRSGFKTRSMLAVPIKYGDTLLGVLQIINRIGENTFSDSDLNRALELAQIIGDKFHYDLQVTRGPFDYLVHKQKLTPQKLEEFKTRAIKEKTSIAHLVLTELKLSPEEVGESLERYYQVPFLKYDPDIELPRDLLKNLNKTYLKNNRWVPVAGNREKAIVLIDDPNDANRIMEIQQVLNARSYEFRVGLVEDILRYLGEGGVEEAASEPEKEVKLEEIVGKLGDEGAIEEEQDIEESSSVSENEAGIVQLVNRLIMDATKMNASDIHVEPSKGKNPAIVRMRVDGACRQVLQIPATHIRAVLARIKIMSKLDIAERRKPQDGKITVKLRGKPVELRVATIPTVNGESAVLRLLAAGGALPMDKLNLAPRNDEETRRLVSHPHGIFLVVGPTGSGKTTTLHAILGYINTPDRKIWTAEDPVEITQPGLQQVQVEPKIGFDFAAAMRSFLRADPDVILIGEMRDRETSHIGVEASLTGHLVFSTLHTNSAPETITRLLDLGLDPLNFADALLGVLAQRLVRTLCSDCKQPYKPSEEEINQLARAYGLKYFDELEVNRNELELYKPGGCKKCGNTGYRGRTGIHELLVATPEMKKLIAKNSPVIEIRDLAMKQGMRTLIQDGVYKILKGQTDFIQLRKVTVED